MTGGIHPEVRGCFDDLQALWDARIPAGLSMPGRQHFDPEDFKSLLGWICLHDVISTDPLSLQWRLVGTKVVELDGADNTGRLLSDVFPKADFPQVIAPYEEAFESRRPVFVEGASMSRTGERVGFLKLVLPLARDGETIDMFLVAMYHAFDASRDLRQRSEAPIPIQSRNYP